MEHERDREAEDARRVSLYRAIGERELNHVLQAGNYGVSPNASGKYFALTEAGARQFAASTFNATRRMVVTRIDVPESFPQRGFRFNDPGGAGSSIHFADDVLPDL